MRNFKLMFLFCCFGMLIFMPSVYADVPKKTVVLGDKAYSFKYANAEENYREIIEQLMLIDKYQIYLKGSYGNWYENSSGKIIDNNNIPFVTYKNGEGKITQYYNYDGEEFKLEVISAAFISDRKVKILFNKEVDKASAIDKSMYLVDRKDLGDNDRIELLEDKKTVVIVLENSLELDKEHNIYVSEKIRDLYHNSISSSYEKKTLLSNDFSKLEASTLNNVDIIASKKLFNSKVINGDIYLSGSNLKVKNCTIKGKMFLDLGENGNIEIANVKADEIVVLSGGEKSIHLIDSKVEKLSLMSRNKSKSVRVALESNTKISKTLISANVILDVVNGDAGTVYLENLNINPITLELRGTFTRPIVLRGNSNLRAVGNAKIRNLNIEPANFNPQINLNGNFERVVLKRWATVRISRGRVNNFIANSRVKLIIEGQAKIRLLEDASGYVEFDGQSRQRVTAIKDEDQDSSQDEREDSNEDNPRHKKPIVRLSNINDVDMNVNQEKIIDLDVDSKVKLEVSSSNNNIVEPVLDGHTIRLTGKNEGRAVITVIGRRDGYRSKSRTFNVTVKATGIITNNAPTVAQRITDQTATVGDGDITIDVSGTFTDADGDTLTISAVSDNAQVASVALNGTELVVTPRSEGTAKITITANDNNGGTVSTTFNVTVNNISVEILQDQDDTVIRVKYPVAKGNSVTIKIIDKSNNGIEYNEQDKIKNGVCEFRVRLEAGIYTAYINAVGLNSIQVKEFIIKN